MISAKFVVKQVEKFAVDNAPAILTIIGATGAVTSTLLAGKASMKASRMIEAEKVNRWRMDSDPAHGEIVADIDNKDKVLLVWREYIPAASVLTITVTSVLFANSINTKRAAALAMAYSLKEKSFNEYKEKVAEKFNPNKERQVRDDIAQDHVTKKPPVDSQIIITGNGDVLCHDLPTGRYFKSNMEKLRSVQNTVNAAVNELGYASLSDFYVALGLTTTPYSEELGWTTNRLLDINFSASLTDDNQPCISIDYTADPVRYNTFPGCDVEPPF